MGIAQPLTEAEVIEQLRQRSLVAVREKEAYRDALVKIRVLCPKDDIVLNVIDSVLCVRYDISPDS